MHSAVLHLSPVLAAEKSKVPFYIAGGLLVAWALLVSAGLGMRNRDFPSSLGGQRVVMAISAVLVLAAVSMAVVSSGGSAAKAGEAGTSSAAQQAPAQTAPAQTAPAEAAKTAPAGKPKAAKGKPKATTGTPAPASSPAPNAATSSLKLAADPSGQLSYDTKQLSAKAGKVTIAFSNASPLEHNVTVAQGSTVLGATPTFASGSKALTLTLKAGTYTFYCSVPGHRQAGMEGTLSVS